MYSVLILIADSAKKIVCADSAIILHADTAKVIIWGTPPRMNNTVHSRKRAHYRISAHPHFGLNLLLRSNVYSNMRPCVAALENAAQMAGYED